MHSKTTNILIQFIHKYIPTYIHTYIHTHTHTQTIRYDAILHSSFKHYDGTTFKCSFHEVAQEIHQMNFTLAEKHFSYESAWL